VKPILQSLKKYSYLAFGAPLLVFLLPFVGQDWSLTVWKNVFHFTFAPLYLFLHMRLGMIRPGSYFSNFGCLIVLIGLMFPSALTGRFAYDGRSNPLIACFYSLTLILLYAILIGYAPRLRKAFFPLGDLETKRVPFDLTAETFRLPPQSNEPADYPR
jgi:hypothetical protein